MCAVSPIRRSWSRLSISRKRWEGEKFDWLAKALADEMAADSERIQFYMAYADGVPACSAWIRYHPGTQFASLWGGSTLPAYRGRGLYTAVLSIRQEAGARPPLPDHRCQPDEPADRGEHGFQLLTFAHVCNWHVVRET